MRYKLIWSKEAEDNLKEVGNREGAENIRSKVDRHLASDPFWHGKELSGRWRGFWRYKIDDYRAIYEIFYEVKEKEKEVIVSVARVGSRGNIYQGELPRSADYGYRITKRPQARDFSRKVVGNRGKRKVGRNGK